MKIEIEVDEEFFKNLSTYQVLKDQKKHGKKVPPPPTNIFDPRNITKNFQPRVQQPILDINSPQYLTQRRQQLANLNLNIKKQYQSIYQSTQNVISDHIIANPEKNYHELASLKKTLYLDSICREPQQSLINCFTGRNRQLCREQIQEYEICMTVQNEVLDNQIKDYQ